MIADLPNIIICPECGSTEYMKDYPTLGHKICTDCGHESIDIKLKTIGSPREISRSCPFCGEERKEGKPIFDDELIIVYKCKKCGKLDGYCDLSDPFGNYYEPHEGNYTNLANEIAKDEGKPILSEKVNRKIAATLNKQRKSPKAKCQEKLIRLIKEKYGILKRANIDPLIMNRARNKAQNEIQRNGPCTEKQLQILYPAALLEAQETLLCLGEVTNKTVSERQLKNIFNVERKTLRKWKNRLLDEKPKKTYSHHADYAHGQRNQKGNTAIS